MSFELLKKQEASAEKTRKMSQLKAELLEARQRHHTDTPVKVNGLSLLGKRAGNQLELKSQLHFSPSPSKKPGLWLLRDLEESDEDSKKRQKKEKDGNN